MASHWILGTSSQADLPGINSARANCSNPITYLLIAAWTRDSTRLQPEKQKFKLFAWRILTGLVFSSVLDELSKVSLDFCGTNAVGLLAYSALDERITSKSKKISNKN